MEHPGLGLSVVVRYVVLPFVATFGHFSPILALHVLAYKVYPSAVALLGLQIVAMGVGAYPLHQLAWPWAARPSSGS